MQNQIINKVISYLAGESSPEDTQLVLDWKKQHPDGFDELQGIYESKFFDEKDFHSSESWKVVLSKISEDEAQPIKKINPIGIWLKIAAVFIGIITIGAVALLYLQQDQTQHFANNTNTTMEVTLPDGSIVMLDKSAEISYQDNLLNQFDRNVELSGRAYFMIEKDPLHPFRVEASQVEIQVLGTKFTVSDRFDRVQVILDEGKVQVSEIGSEESYLLSNFGQQLIINSNGLVKQDVVNKNLYFSWMEEKLHFENCSVGDAVHFLKDSYDIDVQFSDSESLNKQLYGSAPSDNPELVIKAIALITGKEITRENGVLKLN